MMKEESQYYEKKRGNVFWGTSHDQTMSGVKRKDKPSNIVIRVIYAVTSKNREETDFSSSENRIRKNSKYIFRRKSYHRE